MTERPLIIHATDLGPASHSAFRHALRVAVALKASLRLVHFHERDREQATPVDAFPHVRETLTRWGLLAPGAPSSAIADQLDLHVSKAEAVATRTASGLAGLMAKAAPDLIVLGTHGRDGIEAMRHGSIAETLTRHARTPALIVPSGAPGFVNDADGSVRLASVLAPVARSPDPTRAIAMANRIVHALGAEARFNLLHVEGAGREPPPSRPEGGHYAVMTRDGPVAQAIVDAADETSAELIVMATEGHNSLADALRGSTTEQVLRRAGRPLLAVPAG